MSTANNTRPIVIGIDHGFGQIKTAHTCFKAGVTIHEKEPTFKSDLLIYEGRYYTIGEEHKTFLPDKVLDQDYYILTLAAIARELRFRGKLQGSSAGKESASNVGNPGSIPGLDRSAAEGIGYPL